MLYEKKTKIDLKRITTRYILPASIGSIILLIEGIIYLPKEFWEIKLIDVVNALAQFATAGAFYLGFRQYKEAKEKERQAILSSECKMLTEKIIQCISTMPVDTQVGPTTLEPVITRLANLGSDFYELFQAMQEDVNKGIARMYWQEMHLHHLIPCVRGLEQYTFVVNCGINKEDWQKASTESRDKIPNLSFEAFLVEHIIETLNNRLIEPRLDVTKWSWLDSFQSTFFDAEKNKDFFWMLLNQPSMKYQAPLFFALHEIRLKRLYPERFQTHPPLKEEIKREIVQ